jgi:hypothetical protein
MILVPNAVLAGLVAATLASLWERHIGHVGLARRFGEVFVPGTAAVLVYWAVALWAKIAAAKDLLDVVARKVARN